MRGRGTSKEEEPASTMGPARGEAEAGAEQTWVRTHLRLGMHFNQHLRPRRKRSSVHAGLGPRFLPGFFLSLTLGK